MPLAFSIECVPNKVVSFFSLVLFHTLHESTLNDIGDNINRELGIGIVPYSPLGRGFFGGKGVIESIPANSFLVWKVESFGSDDKWPCSLVANISFQFSSGTPAKDTRGKLRQEQDLIF